jgi:formylglycine-generating enzyme required for sulfatase activity
MTQSKSGRPTDPPTRPAAPSPRTPRLRGRARPARALAAGALALGVLAAGCGPGGSGGAGSGGAPGSGGAVASTGGHSGAGGVAGVSGAGGASGAGGSGGAPGTGGSGSGGAPGVGGGAGTGSGGAGTGAGAEPPSCAARGPGLSTCGPNGDESCCLSLPVTGGTFDRTYTNTGGGATGKADPATVSSFRLDKYEVTVGRFRQYVNDLAGGGAPPASGSGKHTHLNAGQGLADSARAGSFEAGWDATWNSNIPNGAGAAATWARNLGCSSYATWTASVGDNEMLPLTCLDWYEAHAFCIWDGGFLPSEAEWKYAAAGGDELRMYAWGSTDPGSGSKYAIYDCYYPTGTPGNCTSLANVAKVGSTPLGVGRWGQLDLAGSVWEWNIDQYAPYVSPCTDCAYLTGAGVTNRVLPGGGFHTGLQPYLLAASRTSVSYATTYRGDFGVGVRCARTP